MISLAAGHAALELLASLNTTNSLQHPLDGAANLALSAARILWFEADGGEQHDFAESISLDFGASVYDEDVFCAESLNDVAIELVLAAGERGAILQGPLSSTNPHHGS